MGQVILLQTHSERSKPDWTKNICQSTATSWCDRKRS